MKEKYEKPDIKLDDYETKDIITTSGSDTTEPWGGEATPWG